MLLELVIHISLAQVTKTMKHEFALAFSNQFKPLRYLLHTRTRILINKDIKQLLKIFHRSYFHYLKRRN